MSAFFTVPLPHAIGLLVIVSECAFGANVKRDPSIDFFATGAIPHIIIEIAKTNLDALRRNDRVYVRATIREGTNTWEEVGIHLKGSTGTKRGIDDRPSFTVNFDKFVDRQKFHGLDKFHLNNSLQDPSLLSEAICSKLFLDAGIPAARVTHARVELNGTDLGVYVLKEGFDRTFLKRHFKNPNGNLYDGGFASDINEALHRESGKGDVKDYSDLRALAAAAQDPNLTNRFARFERLLDLDSFLDFCALEIMICHTDGYAMKRNNYRVYHDPETDKIHFFPHGMDQTFGRPDAPILTMDGEGLVYRALIETPQGRTALGRHENELLTKILIAETVINYFAFLQSRLRPSLQAVNVETASNQSNAADIFCNRVLARIQCLKSLVNQLPQCP